MTTRETEIHECKKTRDANRRCRWTPVGALRTAARVAGAAETPAPNSWC